MTFEGPVRLIEEARSELKRTAVNASGWSDKSRRNFDRNRLEPLDAAGRDLFRALQRAHEDCQKAKGLLAER